MDFMSEPGSREGLRMLSMKTHEHTIKDGTSPLQQILVVALKLSGQGGRHWDVKSALILGKKPAASKG